MQKIILYYKFVPIPDPETVCAWQKSLCQFLNLKGRILISDKGINGTLGGDFASLKAYKKAMNSHTLFKDIDYKWSDGAAEDFPKLSVKVRAETVTLGWEPKVSRAGVVGGGKHLSPQQVNELVKEKPETVFFDGRNNYESAIGKFKNAVTPNVTLFKEFISELDKPEYEKLKDKPVVAYCTGGIRCETLTALMKQKGFKEVYQIEGGVVKYGQEFGSRELWEGKCFVFDKRMSVAFDKETTDIGECSLCKSKTSRYINCADLSCHDLILVCEKCGEHNALHCTRHGQVLAV